MRTPRDVYNNFIYLQKSLLPLILTLSSRTLGAIGSYALVIVVAREGGPESLAEITIFINVLILFSYLAMRGYNVSLLRDVSITFKTKGDVEAKKLLFKTLKKVWWSVILATIGGSLLLYTNLLGEMPRNIIINFIFALPLFTLLAMVAGYLNGVNLSYLAPTFELGGISLAASIILFLFLNNFVNFSPFLALNLAMLLSIFLAYIFLKKTYSKDTQKKNYEKFVPKRMLGQRSTEYCVIAISSYLIQGGIFLLAAPILSVNELGLLRGAERLASIVSFPSISVSLYIAPRIVHQYNLGSHEGMLKIANKGLILAGILSLPPLIIISFFYEQALLFMGNDFLQAKTALFIMLLVNFIIALTSPYLMAMIMAGQEKASMLINLYTLTLALILIPALTSVFGTLGFLIAYSIIILFRIVASIYIFFKHV